MLKSVFESAQKRYLRLIFSQIVHRKLALSDALNPLHKCADARKDWLSSSTRKGFSRRASFYRHGKNPLFSALREQVRGSELVRRQLFAVSKLQRPASQQT